MIRSGTPESNTLSVSYAERTNVKSDHFSAMLINEGKNVIRKLRKYQFHMKQKYFTAKQIIIISILVLANFVLITDLKAQIAITNLQVEYTKNPIGIDVKSPRFSWQMEASAGGRNYVQTGYQIEVKDPKGVLVWNSKKNISSTSVGVIYTGPPLNAATRYSWTVTVWDHQGKISKASSWFETGLMNPDIAAWDGASWIGGGNEDLVLYAQYLPLFILKYDLAIAEGSSRASIILGANDPRLMDRNKNIMQIASGKDKSYFKVELDISGVDGSENGNAKINIYRAGYTLYDNPSIPVKSFDIKTAFINNSNKYNTHQLAIRDQYGELFITLGGSNSFFVEDPKAQPAANSFPPVQPGASVNLNPMGRGHDYITFGMLCDMGFAVDSGQQAVFKNVRVTNIRNPSNALFYEDLAKPIYDGIYKAAASDNNSGFSIKDNVYELNGNNKSVFVVADPSRNSMPMLRTNFTVAAKKIEGARLYITSRGIYEVYLNGKRVGDDYFNPGLTQYNVTHLYQTYDVTNMVSNGQNALGAMLGEGWWSGLLSFGAIWNHFGDRQSLLAKLVITYQDGTKDIITSNDRNWKYYNKGPVVYSSLNMGEVYDATREAAVKNWSTATYDDSNWKPAIKVSLDGTVYREGAVNFMGVKEKINYDKLSTDRADRRECRNLQSAHSQNGEGGY